MSGRSQSYSPGIEIVPSTDLPPDLLIPVMAEGNSLRNSCSSPDCRCDECATNALTDDDRRWLRAHGWVDTSGGPCAVEVASLIGWEAR